MHQNLLYAKVEEVSNNNLKYEECSDFTFEILDGGEVKVTHMFNISTPFFKTIYENYQIEGIAR